MKLLVLGGSGGVGRHLVQLAAQRGHAVRATVRPGSSLDLPRVEVRAGDVFDRAFLEQAVAGCDAVASTLGLRRAGKSPYSRILHGTDVVERAMAALIPVLQRQGPRRISIVSGGGVGAPRTVHPIMRLVFRTSSIRHGMADLLRAESLLAASGLDWQAVRPTTLTDDAPTGRVRLVPGYRLTATIPRADVAAFMLDQLEKPTFGNDHTPTISVT